MATQPSLRIGDRERDAVAAELREHYAHGRLTLEEFNQRLDAAFAAKTQRDLARITNDLPHVRPAGAPLPSSRQGGTTQLATELRSGGRSGSGAPVGRWAGPDAAGGWTGNPWSGSTWPGPVGPGANWSGGDWSRNRGRPRHGIGLLATILAAVASWLLVYDVILVGVQFPWPGRIGLLAVIFAMIRGMLRHIFRGTRGRRVPRRW
jgi:hypothetical protein